MGFSLFLGCSFALLNFANAESPFRIGGVDGGGGVAVRCNTEFFDQKEFELLDIHEARLSRMEFSHNPANEAEAIELAARLFAKQYWNPWTIPMEEYSKVLEKTFFGPFFRMEEMNFDEIHLKFKAQVGIPLSDDLGQFQVGPFCNLEQVMYWNDRENVIYYDPVKLQELDWLSRVALVIHELDYFIRRHSNYGGMDDLIPVGSQPKISSELSREFVGKLLSNQGLPGRVPLDVADWIGCSTSVNGKFSSSMIIFPSEREGFSEMSFVTIQGKHSPYRMNISFPTADIQDWKLLEENFQAGGWLNFEGAQRSPPFYIRIVKDRGSRPRLQLSYHDSEYELDQNIGPEEEIACRF